MTFGYFPFSHDLINIAMLPSKSWCIKIAVLVFDNFLPILGWLLGVVFWVTGYVRGWALTYLAIFMPERLYVQCCMNTPIVPHPCQALTVFFQVLV